MKQNESMKQFVKITFFALAIMLAFAGNSFAECSAKAKFLTNFDNLFSPNGVGGDCDQFKFENIDGIFAAGNSDPASARGGVIVSGKPYIARISNPDFEKDGVYRVTLQITCAGAARPRIGWMPTHLYYTVPFQEEGKKIEFPGFIGLGEQDGKDSVILTGADHTEGGAKVFPMTEQIGCQDLDHPEQSMILKNVIGDSFQISPSIRLIGAIKYANPSELTGFDPNDKRFAENLDEEFDNQHIPAGKLITACFTLNIHPTGDEAFQLVDETSRNEKVIYEYKEKDPHTFNPCETFAFDEAGKHEVFLRWQPSSIDSNKLSVGVVKK